MSRTPKNICGGYRAYASLKRRWGTARRRLLRYYSSGRWGERAAKRFLESQGVIVLTSNWRAKSLEADLIVCDGRTIAVVEVKTRNSRFKSRFPAIGAITDEKHNHLIAVGRRFMRNHGPLCRRYALRNHRIDIIEVYYRRARVVGRRVTEIAWHRDFCAAQRPL